MWKTFSVSPFANNALFIPTAPTVTTVTVAPSTVTADVGQTVQFTATVTTTGFAPKAVTWSTNSANVDIDSSGKATINTGATGSVTVTATSVFDGTKKGTATLTIG